MLEDKMNQLLIEKKRQSRLLSVLVLLLATLLLWHMW
jgi:ubiquinone biosynthesis protein